MVPTVSSQLLFKYPEFNAQLLRTLGKTSVGGADIGECFATASQIKDGDHQSWYSHWLQLANRIFEEGQYSENNAHYVSAVSSYLRASEYYRQAEWFLRCNLDDPRIAACSNHLLGTFRRAIPFLPYYIIPIEIPFENSFLYGYFCQLNSEKKPKATIILSGGYDSFCEELYFTAVEFLKRDYNVLIFDGPGQGHSLRKNRLFMRPDWENVIKPILEFAKTLPFTAVGNFILMGRSFGGFLSARAASCGINFKALVCDPGHWDVFESIEKKFAPEVMIHILQKQDEQIKQAVFDPMFKDPAIKFYFQSRMEAHGVSNPCEWIRMLKEYSLKEYVKKINCPTFICYATAEDKAPGQAQMLADAMGSLATLMEFTTAEGAGDHCEIGALQLFSQRVGDRLDGLI
jgi:pimeloyl-ACP methyl ester carboxylesterase